MAQRQGTRHYIVVLEFEASNRASYPQVRDFITQELESGGGNRHPDDPLFDSLENVRVSRPIKSWRNPNLPKIRPANVVDLKGRR